MQMKRTLKDIKNVKTNITNVINAYGKNTEGHTHLRSTLQI